mmetsp:Transcript_19883/g.29748  ORF Transcript_19883/g.29748 Transcript_19883/m.29748 type:complete len:828 (+) Transcript_19883:2-2485(+)
MKAIVLALIVVQTEGFTCPKDCSVQHCAAMERFETTSCLESTVLEGLDITPSDREGSTIKFEIHNHPSQITSTAMTAFLLRDAMGYNVEWNCAPTGVGSLQRMANGDFDALIEYPIENFPEDSNEFINIKGTALDAGFIGYTAQSGVFIPDYMVLKYNLALAGRPDVQNLIVNGGYEFWNSLQIPEIVQLYATEDFSIPYTLFGVDHSFSPPWCTPWNPTGVGNNCGVIHAESPLLDTGVLEQMIVNLRLNFSIAYWGVGDDGSGIGTVLFTAINEGRSVILKIAHMPQVESFVSFYRVNFSPYSQRCYQNNTASLDGIGSVNCDYPIISQRKMASASIMAATENSPNYDFTRSLHRFSWTNEERDVLFMQLFVNQSKPAFVHNGEETSLGCEWLRDNTEKWSTWVANDYVPPNRKTWTLEEHIKNAIIVLSSLSLTTIFTVFTLLIIFRQHVLIKAISRTYSILSLFGFALLASSALFLLTDEPNASICTASIWLPPLGTSIALAALGVKTHRIHSIFSKLEEDSSKLSDLNLLPRASVYVAVILLILIIQYGVNGGKTGTTVVESGNDITTYHHCSFDHDFFYAIASVLFVMTFYIVKLAYDSREAPDQFNEAKELGMASYTIFISGIVGLPLVLWMESNNEFTALQLTLGLLMTIPPMFIVIILFGLRLAYALIGLDESSWTKTYTNKNNFLSHGSQKLHINGRARTLDIDKGSEQKKVAHGENRVYLHSYKSAKSASLKQQEKGRGSETGRVSSRAADFKSATDSEYGSRQQSEMGSPHTQSSLVTLATAASATKALTLNIKNSENGHEDASKSSQFLLVVKK